MREVGTKEAAEILTERLGFQVNQPTVTRHAREKGLGRVVGRVRLLTMKDMDKLAGWVREEPCWAGDESTRKKMSKSAKKRWAREREEDSE